MKKLFLTAFMVFCVFVSVQTETQAKGHGGPHMAPPPAHHGSMAPRRMPPPPPPRQMHHHPHMGFSINYGYPAYYSNYYYYPPSYGQIMPIPYYSYPYNNFGIRVSI